MEIERMKLLEEYGINRQAFTQYLFDQESTNNAVKVLLKNVREEITSMHDNEYVITDIDLVNFDFDSDKITVNVTYNYKE